MKKIIFLFAAICCMAFATNAENPLTNNTPTKYDIKSYSKVQNVPDCVAGWKFVGTFEAVESSKNEKTVKVDLYYDIMGTKEYRVVRTVDEGFIFRRDVDYCYKCKIEDGTAYFQMGNSLYSLTLPKSKQTTFNIN